MPLHSEIYNNNDRENLRLLDMSSETESDEIQTEITPASRKKIRRKRERNRSHSTHSPRSEGTSSNGGLGSARRLLIAVVAGGGLVWLITLTCITAALNDQLSRLDYTVAQVTTGSEGVRDALQQCHSTARELRANTTELAERMALLYAAHKNLSSQVLTLESGLLEVQRRLSAAPELADAPRRLDEVRESVASLGARIDDVSARLVTVKEQAGAVSLKQDYVAGNVTLMKEKMDNLSNQSSAASLQDTNKALEPMLAKQTELQKSLEQLNTTLSSVNTTLATELAWAAQDLKEYRKLLSGMQDSLQNSSVSVLGLQAAWTQTTHDFSSNVTQLNHNLTDLAADMSDLREAQSRLTILASKLDTQLDTKVDTKLESKVDTKPDSPSSMDVQSAPAVNSDLKTLYGNLPVASQFPPSQITTKATVAPKQETGKPSILERK